MSVRITNDKELQRLLETEYPRRSVEELIIEENCCNDMEQDLRLCGFDSLERIMIKKNSLKNIKSLVISDNSVLKRITTENGYEKEGDSESMRGAFANVMSLSLNSTIYD